jgi:hypothetical protein
MASGANSELGASRASADMKMRELRLEAKQSLIVTLIGYALAAVAIATSAGDRVVFCPADMRLDPECAAELSAPGTIKAVAILAGNKIRCAESGLSQRHELRPLGCAVAELG